MCRGSSPCVCVFVCNTQCNVEVIIHTVTCQVYVSSDGETVCSLLAIASLSTFLRKQTHNHRNNFFHYKYTNAYTNSHCMQCCNGIPNVPLLQNGRCNMAAIHISHFAPLQSNIKSSIAICITSPAINSNTTASPGHTDVTQSSRGT